MSYEVVISDDASVQLEVINNYLRDNFGPNVRKRVMDDLLKTISSLGVFPNKGQSAKNILEYLDGFSYLHTKRNTIFYQVNDSLHEVQVLNVLDNREDLVTKLSIFDIK
ncbi:type II toxin-antitoxin system RelE/ParE family toxin [Lentilactobacillus otakiensis]|nr:type II toxin-antitoxin system RelE/ParE family toxin [Lentilactobacillus otakiensis]MBZ3777235.1 type II toxin-antitoxin system RelE/ParE family toxin [Lentilactobacillus otakiensis]MDV3517832.1 type II toxin-antitoxin system RelE/ParE family toxin [Lentilactobacillus otakiensis]